MLASGLRGVMPTGGVPAITVPPSASMSNLDPCSVFCWFFSDIVGGAQGNNTFLFTNAGATGQFTFRFSGNVGGFLELQSNRMRNGTANPTNYVSNNHPVNDAHIPFCVLATINTTVTPTSHIYVGSAIRPLQECTYGTASDGSGTIDSDAGATFYLFNQQGLNRHLVGDPLFMSWWAAELTRDEGERLRQQTFQNLLPADQRCHGLWRPGRNGSGMVLDESGYGNHSVISGGYFPVAVPNVSGGLYRPDLLRRSTHNASPLRYWNRPGTL